MRILTKKEFDAVPQIISKGEGLYPSLFCRPIRWVAKKGSGNDWAIYYAPRHWSYKRVIKEGSKVYSKEVILTLVPCDLETLSLYRS